MQVTITPSSQIGQLRRSLLRLGDRRGARWLLGHVTSQYLRHRNRQHARVTWCGNWVHEYRTETIVNPTITFHPPEYFEKATIGISLWAYVPKEGDIVIDIGAGIGTEVLTMSRLVGDGKVIAIEAHPRTYQCLVETCTRSGLKNVTPLNVATAATHGELIISNLDKHVSNSIVSPHERGIRIPAKPLDAIISELDFRRIDFIKMNIEGSETDTIRGMTTALAITRNICVACHDFKADRTANEFFRSKMQVRRMLLEYGFELFERSDDRRPFVRDYVYGRKRESNE